MSMLSAASFVDSNHVSMTTVTSLWKGDTRHHLFWSIHWLSQIFDVSRRGDTAYGGNTDLSHGATSHRLRLDFGFYCDKNLIWTHPGLGKCTASLRGNDVTSSYCSQSDQSVISDRGWSNLVKQVTNDATLRSLGPDSLCLGGKHIITSN